MERNASADTFVDCVIRRTSWDTVVNPLTLIAAMIVPAIIAFDIAHFVLSRYDVMTYDGMYAGVIVGFVTEAVIIGFLIHKAASSSAAHQKRDDIWAGALADYVESKGGDASKLRTLASAMHRKSRLPLSLISGALFGFNVVYLVGLMVYFVSGGNAQEDVLLFFVVISYILLVLQFLLTAAATYGFPYAHEKAQIAFTEELTERLSDIGVKVPPMKRAVGRTWWVPCIVLLVVTLGLFSLVMFVMACRSMNHHIANQWDYETGLMTAIIRKEGGEGIRPVEGAEPGMAKKLIRSLI